VDGHVVDSRDSQTLKGLSARPPLFECDLMRLVEDSGFSLSTQPKAYMNLILSIFDRVADFLSGIKVVE
jgi:hypothetical protein